MIRQNFGRAFEPACAAGVSAVDALLAPVPAAHGIFLLVQTQSPVQMQQMRSFTSLFLYCAFFLCCFFFSFPCNH